ncbi:hypothetical protein VE03_03188 [Pseudogymnoascus sp. 23342-1-I1]|nr:hypothetical protein VE03_03188 [Pseudogymnoascus sp. 23342-1-I1]
MESETLCASILLQLCELIVNDDIGDWSGLAGGTKFLIRSRGVHRYNSPFDLAMLESQMSFVLGQSLKSKEPCFLCAPEWQALVLQIPAWPFQNLQSKTLSLRSRLGAILVESPSLIMQFSAINAKYPDQTDWEEQSGILMQKALILLGQVKRYHALEAEPLLLSYASPQKVVQERIEYPDVISGVLDCVANTALLTIDNILRSLCDLRLRSFGLDEKSRELQLKTSQLLDDPEIVEQWRQRAIVAFNFVHGESVIAAKPLAFGLRHAQCGDFPNSAKEMLDQNK